MIISESREKVSIFWAKLPSQKVSVQSGRTFQSDRHTIFCLEFLNIGNLALI